MVDRLAFHSGWWTHTMAKEREGSSRAELSSTNIPIPKDQLTSFPIYPLPCPGIILLIKLSMHTGKIVLQPS